MNNEKIEVGDTVWAHFPAAPTVPFKGKVVSVGKSTAYVQLEDTRGGAPRTWNWKLTELTKSDPMAESTCLSK